MNQLYGIVHGPGLWWLQVLSRYHVHQMPSSFSTMRYRVSNHPNCTSQTVCKSGSC